jgi:hypothetical protein
VEQQRIISDTLARVTSSDPQPGDIIVYRERRVPAGPCAVGTFQGLTHTPAPTYADALREAHKLAVLEHVDVWTTYRVRWTDAVPQTFERLAQHRPQPLPR